MTMSAHPALVLNADFRPMSYFPLSLLSWQDAVHAVFSERISVVAEYDTWARSPSTRLRLPSVVALHASVPTERFRVWLLRGVPSSESTSVPERVTESL